MARLTDERRDEIRKEIHTHLLVHGPQDWDRVHRKFPEISQAAMFKYIKQVRDQITAEAAQDSPEALVIAQSRVKTIPEDLRKIQEDTGKVIPCAPSPRIVASLGDKGRRHLDLMSRYDVLWEDYLMLRRFGLKVDEDGRESIKNPAVFEKSIRHGLQITQAQMEAVADVYNMDQIGELYSVVMEEIGKVSPELQHTILLRLRALNNKLAMTADAKL